MWKWSIHIVSPSEIQIKNEIHDADRLRHWCSATKKNFKLWKIASASHTSPITIFDIIKFIIFRYQLQIANERKIKWNQLKTWDYSQKNYQESSFILRIRYETDYRHREIIRTRLCIMYTVYSIHIWNSP